MNKTTIGWTRSDDGSPGYTLNTVTGCTKVSPGCEHCYAEALSLRFGRSKHPWTKPFEAENVRLHPERLRDLFTIKEPGKRVFLDSMADLFHDLVPADHIARVFAAAAVNPHVVCQILTKRPQRTSRLLNDPAFVREVQERVDGERFTFRFLRHLPTLPSVPITWPLPNVWLGTSVEDQRRAEERIPWLTTTPAAVRFLSCEPLLGPVDLTDITVLEGKPPYGPRVGFDCLTGYYHGMDEYHRDETIQWVIAGGESGPHFRPMDLDWARWLRDQCQSSGVAYYFKQSSGRLPERGRELDGRTWDELPATAAVVGAGS